MSEASWPARVAWGLNALALVATLVAYASPRVAPSTLWPVSFAALAFPSLAVVLLALGGFWAFRGQWVRALLNLAVLALGYGHVRELIGFGAEADPARAAVTFASYNLYAGQAFAKTDSAALAAQAQAFAACVGADVLAVQEAPRRNEVADAVQRALATNGLTHAYRPSSPRIALYSRYPLLGAHVAEAYNELNAVLQVDVLAPGGDTLRVFAAHLESNRIRLDASQMALDAAQADPRAYRTLKGVAANYYSGARARSRQTDALATRVAASPYPVVVLGDLNDVPLSYPLGTLRRAGLVDAFREAGRGLGVTYAGTVPGLRIDYVLASPELRPLAADVPDCDFSDHRPTRATLALPSP